MIGFSSWYPLTDEGIAEHAPKGPAAIQVRRADGLVDYPSGKSAMVWYGYLEEVEETLREVFADEIDEPGARGHGPLQFRYMTGEGALEDLEKVADKFARRFGGSPVFNGG